MHMADALVAPAVAATMYACSAVAAGYSVKKVKLVDDPKRRPAARRAAPARPPQCRYQW